jgi:hypothetical protein
MHKIKCIRHRVDQERDPRVWRSGDGQERRSPIGFFGNGRSQSPPGSLPGPGKRLPLNGRVRGSEHGRFFWSELIWMLQDRQQGSTGYAQSGSSCYRVKNRFAGTLKPEEPQILMRAENSRHLQRRGMGMCICFARRVTRFVPAGQLKIAQRFIAGKAILRFPISPGRTTERNANARHSRRSLVPPGLEGETGASRVPALKDRAISTLSLRDRTSKLCSTHTGTFTVSCSH